jgi:hypothetical protein
MTRRYLALIWISMILGITACLPCAPDEFNYIEYRMGMDPEMKMDGGLQSQLKDKEYYLQHPPSEEELDILRRQGMNVEDFSMQKVSIHFAEKPTPKQVKELADLGCIMQLDKWRASSWYPPSGYYHADIPIDKALDVASRDDVLRLSSLEGQAIFPHLPYPVSTTPPSD